MQIEKRLKNYYKRWNIIFEEEESFLRFKNRLISILDRIVGEYLTKNPSVDRKFIEIVNYERANKPNVKKSRIISEKVPATLDRIVALPNRIDNVLGYKTITRETEKGFGDTKVYQSIDSSKNAHELALNLQILFWALEEKHEEINDSISKLITEIRKISILSPNVGFEIHQKGGQVIIYPCGDPFLDDAVINCTLSGLESYPKAAKPFEEALKIYQSGEISQYRNLLDNLRFSLEQLLRSILKNKRNLENQKDELLSWIGKKGLHDNICNLYEKLLSSYQNYQNNAVKHYEAFSPDEVEFMIYLTGIFIRLLLLLARSSNDSPE
ncbi:hypothetical protein V0288_10465 [Pannus brasiliensis CCIBt3594]|uniref:Uncharacterized protein n=1 Tax=Pannus brasiliensis CCIBt3594 TaxID=1427578 RepID=A0AAW9QU45_9CHRO